MSKYNVNCSTCGKDMTVRLVGSSRDIQWRLDNWTWLCDECQEAEKLEASTKAAKASEEAGLPELEGTEKQIKWAEVLRVSKLKWIDEDIAEEGIDEYAAYWDDEDEPPIGADQIHQAIVEIKGQKAASFWIDRRDRAPRKIIREFLTRPKAPDRAERALEKEAAEESTVRPGNTVSETVAEIRVLPGKIEIRFSERRDDFRKLIKKDLRYSWAETHWLRKIGLMTGTVQDRAAEAANKILAAGFPVRVFDATIRTKAVEGDYIPECYLWILRRSKGVFDGWFSIQWRTGDFYKAAKRLPGARYDSPAVVVPREHFEEVLDFAKIHGFQLTPGAIDLVEEARAAKGAALKVGDIHTPKSPEKPTGERANLEIPQTVEIPDELKD